MHRRPAVISTLIALVGIVGLTALPACTPSQSRPRPDFNAPDTAGRVPAIVGASRQADERTLAELVHALSDEDAAVRLFAIQSLYQRTGQSLGYRYYDPVGERRAAVQRWYAWLFDRGGNDEPVVTGYDALPTTED